VSARETARPPKQCSATRRHDRLGDRPNHLGKNAEEMDRAERLSERCAPCLEPSKRRGAEETEVISPDRTEDLYRPDDSARLRRLDCQRERRCARVGC